MSLTQQRTVKMFAIEKEKEKKKLVNSFTLQYTVKQYINNVTFMVFRSTNYEFPYNLL